MPPTIDSISRRGVMQFAGIAAAGAMLPRATRAGERAPLALSEPLGKPTAPAAAPPAQPPGFYRFKIGGLSAVVLSDGFAKIGPIHPMFAAEANSKDEVDRTLEMNFHPTDAVNVEFNVLCVKIGPEIILIDSGSGSGAKGTTGKLAGNLAAAGIRPEQITAVVVSHAHGDHISGLVDGERLTYPNARIFMNKVEHDFWAGSPDLATSRLGADQRKGMIAGAQRTLAQVKPKLELVKGGDKIVGGLELVDTPGHTPGHLTVIIADGKDQLVAIGDLAHNHVIMFDRPSWTVAFDVDPKMAAETRKKMFERFTADRARILAYHLPWPGLGHISSLGHRPRMESGYAWVIEPWSWQS